MEAPSRHGHRLNESDILMDFVLTENKIVDDEQVIRKGRCCEGLTRNFLLWLLFTFRVGISVMLASIFLTFPAVSALVPRPSFFLVVLVAMLSVRPVMGMGIMALYSLPIIIGSVFFSTAIAYLLSTAYPAFFAFIVVLGVFAIFFGQAGPVASILSAIWIVTLTNRFSIPYSIVPLVPAAYGLAVGFCLAACASTVTLFLPPLMAKKVVDGAIRDALRSLGRLHGLVVKEFVRPPHGRKAQRAALQTKSNLRSQFAMKSPREKSSDGDVKSWQPSSSYPRRLLSSPQAVASFINAASGHGFHNARKLEQVERLMDDLSSSLDRWTMMSAALQAEKPFGSMQNYASFFNYIRIALVRVKQMRAAMPGLSLHSETRIHEFRTSTGPILQKMTEATAACLDTLADVPADGSVEALARAATAQKQLEDTLAQTRDSVRELRVQHFGDKAKLHEEINQELPVKEILSTHACMATLWSIAFLASQLKNCWS